MRLPDRLSPRVGAGLFGLLALLTVGAFYLTQHLKVLDPLVNGGPRADPATIDPRFAGTCPNEVGRPFSYRGTRLGFFLTTHADTVIVRVIDADGNPVADMAGSGRVLPKGDPNHYSFFTWNGRLAGGAPAPAGTYGFRVALVDENRTFDLPGATVQVLEARPRPRVSDVTVSASTSTVAAPSPTSTTAVAGTGTYLTPGRERASAAISTGGPARDATLLVLRSRPDGSLQRAAAIPVDPHAGRVTWDGRIDGRPAPAGAYVLGLGVTDVACTAGRFPAVAAPAPASTAGAGVDVTYLSAIPPLTPAPAGSLVTVPVLAGGAAVHWSLFRGTADRPVFSGADPNGGPITVRLRGVGLYRLTLHSGTHTTAVPLVARAVGARTGAPVLVVLPALTWAGANATDDGDGLISTLGSGRTVGLRRPFVAGLPSGYGDEAALLAFLDARGLPYDLTTDVALALGSGPALANHHGVLLDGSFTWLPAGLTGPLNAFAAGGGGVFTDGLGSLGAVAPLGAAVAGPARSVPTDPFGVRRSPIASAQGQLITPFTDGLRLFADTPALQYPTFQALAPPGNRVPTLAGIAASAPAVVGFHLGRGTVVEAALPDFGASLAAQPAAGALLDHTWQTVLR